MNQVSEATSISENKFKRQTSEDEVQTLAFFHIFEVSTKQIVQFFSLLLIYFPTFFQQGNHSEQKILFWLKDLEEVKRSLFWKKWKSEI